MSRRPRIRTRSGIARGLVAGLLAGAACTAAAAFESSPVGKPATGVIVSFDARCTSAEIAAAGQIAALVVVLSDDSRERITGLERASVYILKLAPAAVTADKRIRTVAVQRGDPDGKTKSDDAVSPPCEVIPEDQRKPRTRVSG